MSVLRKSLVRKQAVANKAVIANTTESKETGSLKTSGMTALSMRRKKGANAMAVRSFKSAAKKKKA